MQGAPADDYKQRYEASQLRITRLESELAHLKKLIFGSRQERFVPLPSPHPQLSLGIETEQATTAVVNTQQITYNRTIVATEPQPLLHPGRMKLPENLRREEIVIKPAGDTTGCKPMGEDVSEVLEYKPGELYVKRYVRLKYALPNGEGVLTGPLPVRPLDKAMAGEGLLAQILIDKYVDHLPLHRQMQRFERSGVKLAYATLTGWVTETAKLITPLYEALRKEVLQAGYLHVDETPIKVLDKSKTGKSHSGYYWVYQNSIDKLVFFDYQEGRGREGPATLLKDFEGYLQTDGYQVYDHLDNGNKIRQLHCMAHARRKFYDEIATNGAVAEHAVKEINRLYAIERKAAEAGLTPEEIKTLRQQEAVPVLDALGAWMKEQYPVLMTNVPGTKIVEALAYSIKRWETLSRYTENGMLKIDNNPVENSIRPVALGRKNYLFAGSHEAAKRSGMLYSLFGTCKMHGIEPYSWLKKVLVQIPEWPVNKVHLLLPHHFAG